MLSMASHTRCNVLHPSSAPIFLHHVNGLPQVAQSLKGSSLFFIEPHHSTYFRLGVVTLEASYERLIELGCNAILKCNIHDVTFEKPRYIRLGRTVMHAAVRDCSA
jgi:hypothetical protein